MKYYEKEYKDLIDGITFKFKKLDAIEQVELAMDSATWESKKKKMSTKEMLSNVFVNVTFSKDGTTFREIVDSEGHINLPELDECPSVILDLYYLFKEEVIYPVFTDSKTFQRGIHPQK